MLESFSGKEQANVETRGMFENGETCAPFLPPGTHLVVVCVATARRVRQDLLKNSAEKVNRSSKTPMTPTTPNLTSYSQDNTDSD
jgi:hypothetical protein